MDSTKITGIIFGIVKFFEDLVKRYHKFIFP